MGYRWILLTSVGSISGYESHFKTLKRKMVFYRTQKRHSLEQSPEGGRATATSSLNTNTRYVYRTHASRRLPTVVSTKNCARVDRCAGGCQVGWLVCLSSQISLLSTFLRCSQVLCGVTVDPWGSRLYHPRTAAPSPSLAQTPFDNNVREDGSRVRGEA
jgi:hypothetical protein